VQPVLALEPSSLPPQTTGFIEINTKAIAQNFKTLQGMLTHGLCAAVLKADAYGFGLKEIAPLLHQEGCQNFFVAHLDEALLLRKILKDSQIYVLSGLLPQTSDLFIEHSLIPVLNDFGMLLEWVEHAHKLGKNLPAVLHFDTGMRRSGFDHADLNHLFENKTLLKDLNIHFVMSHLVSSHDSQDPLNLQQKDLFDALRLHFPNVQASLADTGGIYLGPKYHYDIARPGKGLFGLYSPPSGTHALRPCLKLFGRILQVRTAQQGESVGYGATHILQRHSKLATIGIGFADGYDRRLSNTGYMLIQGLKAPVVGRISMDYTVIDVTDIPESLCYVGGWAELVNETLTLDTLAHSIGTISRELSTGFGQRLSRQYV
jgi:alanine racemase